MERTEMKTNLMNLSKVVVFMLIFVILLNVLSPIFEPKKNIAEAGIKYEMARGFYGEKKNSLDVVAIGNSDLYSAMVPLQLWNEHGIASYVCGEPSQTIMDAYYLLKDVMSCQKPKLVILEVDELFTKGDADDLDDAVSSTLRNNFPIFEYHSRWKDLTVDDFEEDIDYNMKHDSKGYVYNKNVKPYNPGFQGFMGKKGKKKQLSQTTQFYLNKFIELANDNGAQVMFTCFPSATTWSDDKHVTIQDYADRLNIQFIDFNTNYASTGFNWITDSRDGGNHLNYDGATKMTRAIGTFLKSNYSLPDHRSDAEYSQWNKEYEMFIKAQK